MTGGQGAPFFSVVVPVHNRADTIGPTLESVRTQTWRDFECIVVDDGSDDGKALLERVHALADPRFRYVHRTNGGGGAARNTGIAAARGRFIAFLDSDDLFAPHKLAVMAQTVSDDPFRIWYSQVRVDRGGGRYWVKPARAIGAKEDVGEYLFAANQVIQTSSMVMSRKTARRIGFDPQLRKGQDLDFCIRAEMLGAQFEMVQTPLTIWTDRGAAGRTSHVRGACQLEEWLEANQNLMTPLARAGYRATVLAYYRAREQPLRAVHDLATGLWTGVPPRIVARQALRCILPQSAYRRLVDAVVSVLSRSSPDSR